MREEYCVCVLASSPGPFPAFQCCTLKSGRASEAKSCERDCAITLYRKHRAIHEPYQWHERSILAFWWSLLEIRRSNWINYGRLQLLEVFNSIAVSIYLFLPFGPIVQSEVSANDQRYLECLDIKCTRIPAR